MTDENMRGRAGGRARAEILPPERKREIAKKAAIARWGLVATHRGNFKKDFGLDIECYVLNDPAKTAVISQRGMGQAIGFSRRGSRLSVFVNSKTMDTYIGRDLREKIEKPLIFQPRGSAAGNPLSERAHGYDATILIDLCNSILAARADGKLGGLRYSRMAEQAQIILSACGKSGITYVVYSLAGYSPSAEEVIAAFKLYVQEEARKYEPEFPNELYMEWHRLYNLAVLDRGKPWQFKHLTVRHVYYPLAKSSGKILALLRALKANGGDQKKKLFQFLNEIGARALRIQLGRVLEMAESSPNRTEYEKKIMDRFGGQRELDLVLPTPSIEPQQPSAQLQLELQARAS
jgi:hypothetical protein